VARAGSVLLERPARSLDGVGTPIVVASHRRSGTHLTLDLLRRNFPACRPRLVPLERSHNAYLNIDRFDPETEMPCTRREALRLLSKAARPSVKTHAEPEFAGIAPEHAGFVRELLDRSRVIYVWRDGMKVMCSMWTWRRVFDPAARVPFSEFIRQTDGRGRSRPRAWAEHVDFDRIIRETGAVVGEIGDFIGETPEPAEPMLPVSNQTRLESYLARLTGDLTSTNQHAAGDRPPTPSEAFSDEDRAFYEDETAGL
jgi:hypothetical protein